MKSIWGRVLAFSAVLAIFAGALQAAAAEGGETPPPTPVPPRGSPSPFPTSLATPSDATREPTVTPAAALLADLDTGQLLFSKNASTPRPIASVTKVMTALISLDALPLHDVVHVDPRAVFGRNRFGATSRLGLHAGEPITVENLLYALLLGSANDAAVELAIAVAGSEPAFVQEMNAQARQLGMGRTRFYSSSGLDDRGRSTPRDLFRLVRAVDANAVFTSITETRFRRIPAPRGPDRVIQNRNALLWLYPGSFGTKTGATAAAGACLVASAEREGRRLVAIVLDDAHEPFSSAAALLEYGFEGWQEQVLVQDGQPEGTVGIRGGTVPVSAGASLRALVRMHGGGVTSDVIVDPSAAFPPATGASVGWLVLHSGTDPLGRVPLVVPSVPPAPARSGPWWARSAASIAASLAAAVRSLGA